ncbi:exported protein of unknown function [Modestobacter italicus]|uniref:Uncharacterized protein n=1 Tax=Modestobacter italicus (strain DSM 44449 / CECT 9708 / BC 501) TaxID=2732864 RepID=I4ETC6_MODI5|nr:exported protein of unknown function [Modestobacter marinus]
MLRVPSSSALPIAASAPPPAPSTPTSANWEAPVNISSDIASACHGSSPAPTAAAPKATPYSPTATPSPTASRSVAERADRGTPGTLVIRRPRPRAPGARAVPGVTPRAGQAPRPAAVQWQDARALVTSRCAQAPRRRRHIRP